MKKKQLLDNAEYAKLTAELFQLVDNLKEEQIDVTDKENGSYNIAPLPEQVEVIYLPSSLQPQFKRFEQNQVRYFKICNFDRPAISIKYNLKHQYSTEKVSKKKLDNWKATIDIELSILDSDFNENAEKTETDYEIYDNKKEELTHKSDRLQELINNFEQYELVQSSFYKFYTYVMLNYQYYDGKTKKFATTQLYNRHDKRFFDKKGVYTKSIKTNLIFLDVTKIKQPALKTSEKVRGYLDGFSEKIEGKSRDLFIKLK